MSQPTCRLYIVLSPGSDSCLSRDDLGRVLDASDIACLLLRCSGDRQAGLDRARELAALAQARDVAVLVEDDPDVANRIGADGVHITGAYGDLEDARRRLPNKSIVGVDAAGSRHRAMEAGERGADYIGIDASDDEMVAWWTGIFEIPCVAFADGDAEAARRAIAHGAEFVALDGSAWRNAETAFAEIDAIARAIDEISRELVP